MVEIKTTTGRVFALVSYGHASASVIRNLVIGRSAWLSEHDAQWFYDKLASSVEATVDGLLSQVWNGSNYAVGSFSDAVA